MFKATPSIFKLALMLMLSVTITPNDNNSQDKNISKGFAIGVWYKHVNWYISAPSGDKKSSEYKNYAKYYKEYLRGVQFYESYFKNNKKLKTELSNVVKAAGINDDNFNSEEQRNKIHKIVQRIVNKIAVK